MHPLRVLAFEPYYGGSHRAFLDTWISGSVHHWTLDTLPARHWKWRMRGSAMWFVEQLAEESVGEFDVLFTCDMISVADLKAMLPAHLSGIPIVCYFHENQLTYPLSPNDWRDYQFGLTNITSAVTANEVWFNSRSHLDAFLKAAEQLLRKMPENLTPHVLPKIRSHSSVKYPPVELPPEPITTQSDRTGPTRILWPHRWEYDKNPKPFFDALLNMHDQGTPFELVMLGETFRTAPPEFQDALNRLEPRIAHAGYLPERADYWNVLASCDTVVSTAIQENFGLAIVEAVLAGCIPVLPDRLSYPELIESNSPTMYLYSDDSALQDMLEQHCQHKGLSHRSETSKTLQQEFANRFGCTTRIPTLDQALTQAVQENQLNSKQ